MVLRSYFILKKKKKDHNSFINHSDKKINLTHPKGKEKKNRCTFQPHKPQTYTLHLKTLSVAHHDTNTIYDSSYHLGFQVKRRKNCFRKKHEEKHDLHEKQLEKKRTPFPHILQLILKWQGNRWCATLF